MDVLELRFESASFPTGAPFQLVPFVNGRNLLELPSRDRKTNAGPKEPRSGYRLVGAKHAGLAVYEGTPPDLSDLQPRPEPHEAAVLGCVCGDTYCSPLMAQIS